MFKPQHCGLTFSADRIQQVRKQIKRPPIDAAWQQLTSDLPDSSLARLHWLAFRYRFNAELAAGEEAAKALQFTASLNIPELIVLAQCIELLRDRAQERWLTDLSELVHRANHAADDLAYVDCLWLAVLNAAAGIVLEDESMFDNGTEIYRQTIDHNIHPEGYIPQAVEQYTEEISLQNQLRCVRALVLIAEMAHHAGVDLWRYEQRGVSVLTATTYPLYYYFYPEKWPWNGDPWKPSDGVEPETAKQIFLDHAGFLEIAFLRYDQPLKAIRMILDDIRPIYDLYGGGFTTLTHAQTPKRGFFG